MVEEVRKCTSFGCPTNTAQEAISMFWKYAQEQRLYEFFKSETLNEEAK